MTDLIPLDAVISALDRHSHGTTTLGGQTYRSITLEVAFEALQAIPTIDPAAIREVALREVLKALDSLPEYGSPDVNIGVSNAYAAILALIGEASSMIGEKK